MLLLMHWPKLARLPLRPVMPCLPWQQKVRHKWNQLKRQIMTCKRTSMRNDLLEWMAVLRMNYDWIEERRSVFEEILTKLDLGATKGFTVLA